MFARTTSTLLRPTLHAVRLQSTAASAHAGAATGNATLHKGLVTKEQAEHRESGLTTSAPSVEIVAADVLNDAPGESRTWRDGGGGDGMRKGLFGVGVGGLVARRPVGTAVYGVK